MERTETRHTMVQLFRMVGLLSQGMAVPDTFPFVNLTVDGQTVTSMTAGIVPEPEPEPEPEPTAEDITLDLMAEHEERLCMLEITTGI